MSSFPKAPADRRPPIASAIVSIGAAVGACFAGLTDPRQIAPFVLLTAGIALFVGGMVLRRRGVSIGGRVITGTGLVVMAGACFGAILLAPPLLQLGPLLACSVGVVLVTVGLFPVVVWWIRGLTLTGLTLVCTAIVTNAILTDLPLWRASGAVVLLLVSWDAAERGITLGKQVGSTTDTVAVEVVGTTATVLVGSVAVFLTVGVAVVPAGHPSVLAIAFLLTAVVALALGLFRFPST